MVKAIRLSVRFAAVGRVAARTAALLLAATGQILAAPANGYAPVQSIFAEHCLDCHAASDPEGKLVLENFETLSKGGESGPVIVPGSSSASLLIKMIEGAFEKDGKKKIMPPGKRKKLGPEEIASIKSWIDAGAKPPAPGEIKPRELVFPKIVPRGSPRQPIQALAYTAPVSLIAIGRYGAVEIIGSESRQQVRKLEGHQGNVNGLVFSSDGSRLFVASGETALAGEITVWNVADGTLVRRWSGHHDSLYSIALSPDGKTVATGSYDQKIELWEAETGREIRMLSGHNGAIFGLAFRPDGKILASASGDRTVKLWDVSSGERRDTLSQSLKELYTVQFSRDGKRVVAGGVDNRIRVWAVSEKANETTNPLLEARFAHEGALLKLAYSSDGKLLASGADDKTVKLWDADTVQERLSLETQSDWPSALVFSANDKTLVVGRLDGSLGFYDVATGKPTAPPKPALVQAEPRGLQRGIPSKIKLIGTNIAGAAEIKLHHAGLKAEILPARSANANELWIQVTAEPVLPRGEYELSVTVGKNETGKIKLHVDDLPQILKTVGSNPLRIPSLPAAVWGTHEHPGDVDLLEFDAKAGETLVFDVAAKSIGSKADALLTLATASGKVLASNNGFGGSADPLLAHTFAEAGKYVVRVSESVLGSSPEHFYRLSIGSFPFIIACYPLSVPAQSETAVELLGYNLPADREVTFKTSKPGEMEIPLDREKFRSRRSFNVLVGEASELLEMEPNGEPSQATAIRVPGAVNGRFVSSGPQSDTDLFRFETKAGKTWVIETAAAQRGSPADTKIEILNASGQPVPRLLLQAVRNSAITFRGIDSSTVDARVDNWEEMELNEFLYLQGEVVKIFRMPQGPDSGFNFYASAGRRKTFFDTTATTHALEEPCYIVQPHPPGTRLAVNGLPVFQINYANDDDGDRKLGSDSKLYFTAPADGVYLVRVSETKGETGPENLYRLVVREARPDFKASLQGTNPTVGAGSGQSFTVSADRIDGFDGEIKIEISGLPPGFSASNPLVIQAGHSETRGALSAAVDAPAPTMTNAVLSKLTATAVIDGKTVTKEITGFGTIKLGPEPKLFVALEPSTNHSSAAAATATQPMQPGLHITIAPGQTIPAHLRIRRNGHDDLVTFTVDNLPHGVIVDNIGLNGVLIPKGENEREIFLTAAKWVPDTDRLCYAIENQAGRQTSQPVWLHVRKPKAQMTATASQRGN